MNIKQKSLLETLKKKGISIEEFQNNPKVKEATKNTIEFFNQILIEESNKNKGKKDE